MLQHGTQPPQKLITGHMSAGVIHHLKEVQVDVAQRGPVPSPFSAFQHPRQVPLELAPVQQAREGIVRGCVSQLTHLGMHFTDVAHNDDRTDDRLLRVTYWGSSKLQHRGAH